MLVIARRPTLATRLTITTLASLLLVSSTSALEFPKYETTTKGNTTVILMKQDRVPLVSIRVTLDFSESGANYDPASAALYLHSIKYGSKNYAGVKWLETLDGVGAELHEDAQPFTITLATEVRKEDQDQTLALLLDGMLNPELKVEKVEQERGRLIAEAKSIGDQPQSLAEQAVDLAFFGADHPYGRSLIGSPSTLTQATARDIVRDCKGCGGATGKLIVTLVGDFARIPREIVDSTFRLYDSLLPPISISGASGFGETVNNRSVVISGTGYAGIHDNPKKTPPAPRPLSKPRVILIDLPEAQQTQIKLMAAGPTDVYSPLYLANVPFGATFTSRLVKKLRTELGLTYGIGSRLTQRPLASTYSISSFTKNSSIGEFLKVLFAEIGKARKEGLSAEEIAKGKALMLGEGPMRWERYDGLAALLERNALYGRPADYPLASITKAQTIDAKAANAALAAALPNDRYVLVLAGPLKLLKPVAAQYGTVEIWTKNQVIEPALK